jgi:hypothetical protein
MKLETSQTFGNATYLLSDREVAAMITEAGMSLSPRSPLSGIDLSVVARTTPDDYADLHEALAALCAPQITVDIRTWPDGGGWISYFGPSASGQMVAYSRNEAGANLIIWPVTQGMLKSMVTAPLSAAVSDASQAPDFTLTFSELLVLASLVDRHQEIQWRAMADRNPTPDIRFDASGLEQSYARGIEQSDDPRWMVSRLKQVITRPLPETLPDAAGSLVRFAKIGLLIEDTDGFAPLPSAGLVLQQLAEIEGIAAVAVHNRSAGTVQHRLYQTNRAQLWCYALDGNGEIPSHAKLKVMSGAALSDDLAALLSDVTAAPVPSAPGKPSVASPEAPSGATLVCPACGTENQAGQKFCSACGANLAIPAAAPSQSTCGKCGAALAPDVKFCTQCGHPVAST